MGKLSPTQERIVRAADQLFYQQGFEYTSFADIAEAVNISRGNFYYHYKTKDEILEAVIRLRLANTRGILEMWHNNGSSPVERITSFIHILISNKEKIKLHGCPVGTLSTELAKLKHASKDSANKLFSLFHTWLTAQFKTLGFKKQSPDLAMHLLARSQGVATMANAFHDEKFIKKEVRLMEDWLSEKLEQLNNGEI